MKTIGYWLSTVLSFFLIGCGCNDGDRPEYLSEASFGFRLVDAQTGKDLYSANPSSSAYPLDSIRIVNSPDTLLKIFSGIESVGFRIDSLYNDTQNQIGQKIEKTYYLYLTKADTDTLQLSFLPVNGKCAPYFTDYQVFYNQRLVASSPNAISFYTEISKP